MMDLGSFFVELRRRNVYKVAVAYAVVAWLLIQAASIFFPAFDAPPWAMKIFIVIVVLGFPIALVFSWAFEITPEAKNPVGISYGELKQNPDWDSLRGDPRFEKIVASLAPKHTSSP